MPLRHRPLQNRLAANLLSVRSGQCRPRCGPLPKRRQCHALALDLWKRLAARARKGHRMRVQSRPHQLWPQASVASPRCFVRPLLEEFRFMLCCQSPRAKTHRISRFYPASAMQFSLQHSVARSLCAPSPRLKHSKIVLKADAALRPRRRRPPCPPALASQRKRSPATRAVCFRASVRTGIRSTRRRRRRRTSRQSLRRFSVGLCPTASI